jgi:hypothetical protein
LRVREEPILPPVISTSITFENRLRLSLTLGGAALIEVLDSICHLNPGLLPEKISPSIKIDEKTPPYFLEKLRVFSGVKPSSQGAWTIEHPSLLQGDFI